MKPETKTKPENNSSLMPDASRKEVITQMKDKQNIPPGILGYNYNDSIVLGGYVCHSCSQSGRSHEAERRERMSEKISGAEDLEDVD